MKQLSFSLISSRWTLIPAGLFSAKIHLSLIFALSASTRFYISSLRQRYCDQRRNSRVSSLGYGKRDDWMEPAPILIIRDVDTWSNCSGWAAQALCTRVQRLLTDLKYSPMSWIFDRGNARLISMIIDIEVNFVSYWRWYASAISMVTFSARLSPRTTMQPLRNAHALYWFLKFAGHDC